MAHHRSKSPPARSKSPAAGGIHSAAQTEDLTLALRSFGWTCAFTILLACCLSENTLRANVLVVVKFELVVFVIAHVVAWVAAVFGAQRSVFGARLEPTEAADDSYTQRKQTCKKPIRDRDYYSYYNGHKISHLEYIHDSLRSQGCRRFVFFCGDSSLDNKHWLFDRLAPGDRREGGPIPPATMRDESITAPAVNGYDQVLTGSGARSAVENKSHARMAKDVCYWLNRQAEDECGSLELCTIMSSVEASTAADRFHFGLLKQDEFIRDRVTENDAIVMSVGGNDVALAPTIATVVNMALLNLSPQWLTFIAFSPGYHHFVGWFRRMLLSYVGKLTAKRRPAKVIVCMIYYPDEKPTGGWADAQLELLLYRAGRRPWNCPGRLQFVIRSLFQGLKSELGPGGGALPAGLAGLDLQLYPLFEAMDGKHTDDYEQRVEPSVQGGQKMARGILAHVS